MTDKPLSLNLAFSSGKPTDVDMSEGTFVDQSDDKIPRSLITPSSKYWYRGFDGIDVFPMGERISDFALGDSKLESQFS